MIVPWVPDAFHARFPVSVKYAADKTSHARKNVWYPGYDDCETLQRRTDFGNNMKYSDFIDGKFFLEIYSA